MVSCGWPRHARAGSRSGQGAESFARLKTKRRLSIVGICSIALSSSGMWRSRKGPNRSSRTGEA
eukprot:8607984-Pyramimonas_sp.AAC.1